MKVALRSVFIFFSFVVVLCVERSIGFPFTTLMVISLGQDAVETGRMEWKFLLLFLTGIVFAVAYMLPISVGVGCLLLLSFILERWPLAVRFPFLTRYLVFLVIELGLWFFTLLPTHPVQITNAVFSLVMSGIIGWWWLHRPQRVHIFGKAKK